MSGGSMGYLYYKVEDAADCFEDKELRDLVKDLAKLLHDLEWYKSGDYGKEDYLESLNEFKHKWFAMDRNERLKKYIDETCEEFVNTLHQMLGEANNG